MLNPTRSQIEAAKAMIAQYGRNYRGTGTDLHHNTAVMAVWATLSGRLGSVPAEYKPLTQGIEAASEPFPVADAVENTEMLELRAENDALKAQLADASKVIEAMAAKPEPVAETKADLEAMTIAELKAFAVDKGIDLQDVSLKADIIAAIREFGY